MITNASTLYFLENLGSSGKWSSIYGKKNNGHLLLNHGGLDYSFGRFSGSGVEFNQPKAGDFCVFYTLLFIH